MSAFIRARAADAAGAADVAAAGYAAALDQAPGDPVVAVRAYREGLAIGDYALAARGAAALDKAGVAPPDTAVLRFAVALHAGDAAGAQAALDRLAKGPLEFMVPVLGAWMAFDRGEDPVALLDRNPGSALARRYSAEHRALLLIATHRPAEGMAVLRALSALGPEFEELRIDAARMLAATGEDDRARTLLAGSPAAALGASPGEPLHPGAAFGASRLFLGLAADLEQENMAPVTILLARAALLLEPDDDRARLYLGQALSRGGSDDALALRVLGGIGAGSRYARAAGSAAVATLAHSGQSSQAIALARLLAEDGRATAEDAQAYGDLLAADGQFDAAAEAYARALGRTRGDGGWRLHLLLGSALDRAGRWRTALPELRRAVALAPDEPEALNALGYAQLEHGADLAGAQALLEHASRLKPDDAAIADSLARAYYRRGDVARALPLLERAAQSDPGGSQVNEHLGDAYWRLGRHYEARYAWRAAAITADNAAAERIRAKLANGLTGAD